MNTFTLSAELEVEITALAKLHNASVSDWITAALKYVVGTINSPADCAICCSVENLHKHHRKPKSEGGSDLDENILILCADCHGRHHGHNFGADWKRLHQAGMDRAKARKVEKAHSEMSQYLVSMREEFIAGASLKTIAKKYKITLYMLECVVLEDARLKEEYRNSKFYKDMVMFIDWVAKS